MNPAQGIRFQFTEEINVWKEYSSDETSGARTATNLDRGHVRVVAKRPCLICRRQPSDAHHLRFAQARALGRKASDEFTVPLCRGHHREGHRCSDESERWRNIGIDPMVVARALWVEGRSIGAGAPLTDVPN